jgi:hypothetical protein
MEMDQVVNTAAVKVDAAIDSTKSKLALNEGRAAK